MKRLRNRFFGYFHVNKYLSAEERQAVVNACDYDDESFWSKIEEICESRPPLVRIAVIYTLFRESKLNDKNRSLFSFIERLPLDFRKNCPWFVYAILAIELYDETRKRHVVIDGDPKDLKLCHSITLNDKGFYKLGFMITTLEIKWNRAKARDNKAYVLSLRKIFDTTLSEFGFDLKTLMDMEFSDMERILMFHLFYWIWLYATSHVMWYKSSDDVKVDDEHLSYWYNLALEFADDVDMDLVNLDSSYTMLFGLQREKEERFCEMEFQYYKFDMLAKKILLRTINDEFIKREADISLTNIYNNLREIGLTYKLCDKEEAEILVNLGKRVSKEMRSQMCISAYEWRSILDLITDELGFSYQKNNCKNCTWKLHKKIDEFGQELRAVKHSVSNTKWPKEFKEAIDSNKQELNGVKSSVSNTKSGEDKQYKDLKETIHSIKEEINDVKSSVSNTKSVEDKRHNDLKETIDSIKLELREVKLHYERECKDLKEAVDSFKEELAEVENHLLNTSDSFSKPIKKTAQGTKLENTKIQQTEQKVTTEEIDCTTKGESTLGNFHKKEVYLQHEVDLFYFPTSRYLSAQRRKEVDRRCESGVPSLCLNYVKHLEQKNESKPVRLAVFCRMFNQMDFNISRELTKQYLDTLDKEFCVKNPSYICALNLLAQNTLSSEGSSESTSPFHCWIDNHFIDKIISKISDEEFLVEYSVMGIEEYLRKLYQHVFECFRERGVYLKRSICELDEIERIIAFSVIFYMWREAVSKACSMEVKSDVSLTEMCGPWNTMCLLFADSIDTNFFELLACCLMFDLLLKEKVPRNDKMKLCYSQFKMAADVFLRRVEDGEFAKREINEGLTVIEKLVGVGLRLELCKGNEAMELLKRAHHVAVLTLPPSCDIGGKLARLMRATFESIR